jgi:ABC-2 type transport system permease protein
MGDLTLLLRPGILGFKNRLSRRHGGGFKKPLFMGGLGLVFGLILFVLSSRVLVYFQSVEMIGDLLAKELLSMVFLTFFSLLIFSNIITALSTLYLSKDLEFCHSAPVSVEVLFAARAFSTFLNSSWMALIFALPILGAYGYVYAPGVGFYVSLLHLMVAMGLIASGLGILLTMILVHVFPAQRTRDVILLLSILMVVGLYLLFRFLRPERLVDPETALSVMHYVSALKTPDSPYLPTYWITEILWGRLQGGERAGEGFYLALTWSTALSLLVLNIWTACFIYFGGFSKAQEAKKRLLGGKRILDLLIRVVTKPFKSDLSVMMAKDIRVFFRDNTQWSQLLLLFALVVVYVYNFKVLPLEKSPLPLDFLQNGLAFLNMGLAGFVLAAVGVRFVFTAVSAEGEAFWILRSSPMSFKRYLWGKFFFFLVPMLFLGLVLIVVTNNFLEVTRFMMLLSSSTMFLMIFGIVSLGLGFGAMYPRFDHENIGQVATGFGGLLYMMVSALFIGAVVVLEAGPVYLLFMSEMKGRPISILEKVYMVFSFAGVLALTATVILKPMGLGVKALTASGSRK